VIGNDLTLLGEKITIICQRALRVDGDVRGNVHGRMVVITESGSVVGTVAAESIEVHGTVRGSIRAVHVALAATANVGGDITQHSLTISEGAQFEGQVDRANDIAQLMPILDPEVIARGEL
jgi:cytoskeletal protein CcmA (bactofilin family)